MIKTEINDRICLVVIRLSNDNSAFLKYIKEATAEFNIKIHYLSSLNFFATTKEAVIAISDDDIYPFLNAMGKLKEKTNIINYSINHSNCMINWEGSSFDVITLFEKNLDEIKFIYENGRRGTIICESEKKHKLLAKIVK